MLNKKWGSQDGVIDYSPVNRKELQGKKKQKGDDR